MNSDYTNICNIYRISDLNIHKQHVVNWLPGNVPTPLSICLFKLALNSLLLNTFNSKAENFNFPDATSPFLLVSPPKEQEDKTIISKLHHGMGA